MVGHVDEPVDPEISFSDGGLIGGQVAVDDEQVGSGGNGIGDEPFEAAGGIAKVAVFVEVGVAGVTDLERHGNSCGSSSLSPLLFFFFFPLLLSSLPTSSSSSNPHSPARSDGGGSACPVACQQS